MSGDAVTERLAMPLPVPSQIRAPGPQSFADYQNGIKLRATDDPVALRQDVYDAVLAAASEMQPIVGKTHTLALTDVHYAEDDPEFNAADEKRAILARESLSRRLRGTWRLYDNATSKEISNRKATVANVPAILRDGSFLRRGNRYVMGYQQRLRPGIYVRHRKSGEAEGFVGARVGTGSSHRYVLEPETGLFNIHVGHAKIPLVPLLQSLGASREEMEAAWGKEITNVNFAKPDAKSLGKLYDRFVSRAAIDPADRLEPTRMQAKLKQAFDKLEVDPEVVGITLNSPRAHIDKDMLLRATAKILRLQQGQEEVDERDNLAFASYHSAPDIFAERFINDYGRFRRDILYKAIRRGDLNNVPSGALDKYINAAIFRSGLASSVEEINPAEILSAATKITRFGEGGLPSTDSAPDESRDVSPSQFGYIDPVSTMESLRVGIDGYLSRDTFIGSDNKLYTKLVDNKTGRTVVRSPDQLLKATTAVGKSPIDGYELAIKNGKFRLLPENTAQYRLTSLEDSFGHSANMVPMKSAMFGQRGSMASRMLMQALAIDNAESPLVQTGVPGSNNESFEDRLGSRFGAIRADDRGRVLEVSPDHVLVKYNNGNTRKYDLDNNRPGARKSVFHQEPLVHVGQEVNPNQLLVKSNYVDNNGTAALGFNARTAMMAWDDAFEDGIVVSDALANRIKLQQAYRFNVQPGEGEKVDKRSYLQLFGNRYAAQQFKNIDDRGVIKVGTTVKNGDPLILGVRERDVVNSRVHRQNKKNWGDSSVIWDHNHDGVVTDVYHSAKGSHVVVRTSKPLEEGDKLAGRAGNKGVITIKPAAQMPHDADGNPIEVIYSPLSVPSRGNSSFPIEMLLAKIARKRGEPYKVQDFSGQDLRKFADDEAKKYGISSTETLIDPNTGRKIKNVLTGDLFLMALHHTAESKQSARGLGSYTGENLPARGGEEGAQAKRYSAQQLWAGLSHGAYHASKEASLLRGVRNDDYWTAFMAGNRIATPKVPVQYNAFIDQLKAAGVNTKRRGTQTQILALTDKDVDELSGGRFVQVNDTVDLHKDLKPITGGFFDPRIFGDGDKFAALQLPEPLPNPAFEEPLRKLLNVTEKDFRNILAGKKEIPGYGSGPAALQRRLASINIEQELLKARNEIAGTRKVARDNAVRRLNYLKSFERTGLHPKDLMITKVPVLPPRLRPISKLAGKGGTIISDPNFLYRELMQASDVLKDLKGYMSDVGDERLAVYDAHRALVGITEPANRELQQRKVKGLLKRIVGDSPKTGIVQRRLLSGNVDTVGRGVIVADTSLDMDSFGLPESMAFKIYEPYIVRNMTLRGIPKVAAMEHLQQRDGVARHALLNEMEKRPVSFSRAPILFKYGDIALQPQLIKSDAIRLNPLVFKGLGADVDGDAVNVNVLHGPEAVAEAKNRMMPSKMLLATKDFETPMYIPTQDMLLGLYFASQPANKRAKTRYFGSLSDAKAALRRGDIDLNTPVRIGR